MRTDRWPQAARAMTILALFSVAVLRRVYIRRRPAQVGNRPAKRLRFRQLANFLKDAVRAATGQKFALMKTKPAKRATARATARHNDRILNRRETRHALFVGGM